MNTQITTTEEQLSALMETFNKEDLVNMLQGIADKAKKCLSEAMQNNPEYSRMFPWIHCIKFDYEKNLYTFMVDYGDGDAIQRIQEIHDEVYSNLDDVYSQDPISHEMDFNSDVKVKTVSVQDLMKTWPKFATLWKKHNWDEWSGCVGYEDSEDWDAMVMDLYLQTHFFGSPRYS